jgi:uncharacterized protein
VAVGAGFWFDRIDAARRVGVPALLARLEEHGVVENFRIRAGRSRAARRGLWFTDSDLYKWMEAACWAGDAIRPDLDAVCDDVLAAQLSDGYLNTHFESDDRFRNLDWSHELYCLGHFIQAAVARFRAQRVDDLLTGARAAADLLCNEFGPASAGSEQRDRHPVVEMALVELYRVTGAARYLDLAVALCDRVTSRGPCGVCALFRFGHDRCRTRNRG